MARTRRPLIAGNWKMNGLRADALALAKGVADGVKQAKWTDREVLVCPPATLVMAVAETVKGSGVLVVMCASVTDFAVTKPAVVSAVCAE